MRRLGLALGLLACLGILAPAQAQLPNPLGPTYINPCHLFAQGTASGTTTQIVAATSAAGSGAIANKGLYVCGWQITSTTATTFQLIAGGGATCGTSTTNLTPASNVATTSVSINSPSAIVYVAPTAPTTTPANGLCIVSGAAAITWVILYDQY